MVVVIPVVTQRLISVVLSIMVFPQLQFLDKVIDDPVVRVVQVLPSRSPVVCNDRCPGYVPQLQLINKAVYIPVVAQSLIPKTFLFSRPSRFPCCRTHGGRCPCCVGRASSTVAVGEETVALPTVAVVENFVNFASRGAEAVSRGLADHRNSTVSLRQGDRRPCCEGRVSSKCRRDGDRDVARRCAPLPVFQVPGTHEHPAKTSGRFQVFVKGWMDTHW